MSRLIPIIVVAVLAFSLVKRLPPIPAAVVTSGLALAFCAVLVWSIPAGPERRLGRLVTVALELLVAAIFVAATISVGLHLSRDRPPHMTRDEFVAGRIVVLAKYAFTAVICYRISNIPRSVTNWRRRRVKWDPKP